MTMGKQDVLRALEKETAEQGTTPCFTTVEVLVELLADAYGDGWNDGVADLHEWRWTIPRPRLLASYAKEGWLESSARLVWQGAPPDQTCGRRPLVRRAAELVEGMRT